MPTKTAHKWKDLPGGYDTVGTEEKLYSDNKWGIPLVRKSAGVLENLPDFLLDYKNAKALPTKSPHLEKAGIHFFIDDYRFEGTWSRRKASIVPLRRFHTVLTPDFSVYVDWAPAVCLWNTYRNRHLGALWQREGVQRVIPTIGWSDESSYDYCFLGVEQGSVVAVATIGIQATDYLTWAYFRKGYEEMVRRINPPLVIGYGPLPDWCERLTPVKCYPTKWDLLHPNKRMKENVYKLDKKVRALNSFMPVPVEVAQDEELLYNEASDRFYREQAKKRKGETVAVPVETGFPASARKKPESKAKIKLPTDWQQPSMF